MGRFIFLMFTLGFTLSAHAQSICQFRSQLVNTPDADCTISKGTIAGTARAFLRDKPREQLLGDPVPQDNATERVVDVFIKLRKTCYSCTAGYIDVDHQITVKEPQFRELDLMVDAAINQKIFDMNRDEIKSGDNSDNIEKQANKIADRFLPQGNQNVHANPNAHRIGTGRTGLGGGVTTTQAPARRPLPAQPGVRPNATPTGNPVTGTIGNGRIPMPQVGSAVR